MTPAHDPLRERGGKPQVHTRPTTHATTTPQYTHISPGKFADHVAAGAIAVDIRPPHRYAEAHIPGSLSLPLCRRWAEWANALIPSDRAAILVADDTIDHQLIEHFLNAAQTTTFDAILAGGIDAWHTAGLELDDADPIPLNALRRDILNTKPNLQILDVRDDAECSLIRIQPSIHIELANLPTRLAELIESNADIVTICRSGVRAMIAATLLKNAGATSVQMAAPGLDRWQLQFPDDPCLIPAT